MRARGSEREAQPMSTLDKSQAFVALSDVYENDEVTAILDTADAGMVFTDELFVPDSRGICRLEVSVRADSGAYTITWN
jgi:hypothetical protein